MGVDKRVEKDKGKGKKVEPIAKTILRPPLYFSWRLKKIQEEGKYQKFISMLKKSFVNISLVETLKQMPIYAKFMKYLVTKKRR